MKAFLRTLILTIQAFSFPAFLSGTNLKLNNITITPKMFKFMTQFDSCEASSPDCIPVVVPKNF